MTPKEYRDLVRQMEWLASYERFKSSKRIYDPRKNYCRILHIDFTRKKRLPFTSKKKSRLLRVDEVNW